MCYGFRSLAIGCDYERISEGPVVVSILAKTEIYILFKNFSMTVYFQDYFVLVSGVEHR